MFSTDNYTCLSNHGKSTVEIRVIARGCLGLKNIFVVTSAEIWDNLNLVRLTSELSLFTKSLFLGFEIL